MNSYKIKYHKNSVLLTAMVVIPVTFISLMFYFLFNIPETSSELSILALTSLLVISIFTILIWIKNTQIFVASTISLNDEGISIQLKKTSFLYRRSYFFSSWNDIERMTEMFDNHNGGYFYQISFKSPHFVVNLAAIKNMETEANRFFNELQHYQDLKNINSGLPEAKKPGLSLGI